MPPVCAPILGAILIPNAGGLASSILLRKKFRPFYDSLEKPSWSPKPAIFAPTWTVLYSSIGYASYLVYKEGGGCEGAARIPLMVYGANLAFNWAWAPIFFGCRNLKAAFADNVLVDATAVATAYLFYKINKTAGYLFIPYLLWLGFETYLSCLIIKANPNIKEIEEEKEE